MRICLYEDIICFLDSTSQLLIFPAIRGYTWHKAERQRYNDDATVVKTSRHSKIKFYSFGLPPKSALFYAFKLGIMHRDQVVSIEPSSRSSKSSSIIQLVLRGLSNKGLIETLLRRSPKG